MTRLGKISRRRWVVIGVALGVVGVLGTILGWSGRDPWPVRVVIGMPGAGDGRARALAWERPQGFTPDGRSYLTSLGAGTQILGRGDREASKSPLRPGGLEAVLRERWAKLRGNDGERLRRVGGGLGRCRVGGDQGEVPGQVSPDPRPEVGG